MKVCANCGNVKGPDKYFKICECEAPDFRFDSHDEYDASLKNPGVPFYTTGQMIDSLKYGELAEAMTGFYEGSKLMRTVHDEIIFVYPQDERDNRFKITAFALKPKWKIYKNPLMTERVCENCKFVEMYSDTCPVEDDDDTEHLDDGLMVSCKCFKGIEATETAQRA